MNINLEYLDNDTKQQLGINHTLTKQKTKKFKTIQTEKMSDEEVRLRIYNIIKYMKLQAMGFQETKNLDPKQEYEEMINFEKGRKK